MAAFERGIAKGVESPLWRRAGPPRSYTWTPAKKGGLYRYGRWPGERFAIATVKQAQSGSWFATLDGDLIDGWFGTAAEAISVIDDGGCMPRQD